MVARVLTLSFSGLKVQSVEIQAQAAPGIAALTIVGLPSKAVSESKERIRAVFASIGLGLTMRRITINLAPADMIKTGTHYDLPIALGLMVMMGVIAQEDVDPFFALGELGLDGELRQVPGILVASVHAMSEKKGLICPHSCAKEASWSGLIGSTQLLDSMQQVHQGGATHEYSHEHKHEHRLLAPRHIVELINHFKGTQMLDFSTTTLQTLKKDTKNNYKSEDSTCACDSFDTLQERKNHKDYKNFTTLYDTTQDMQVVKGQEDAKRALEIAAAGFHHLLMIGPPGVGKSMLARCLPSILPNLHSKQILEVFMLLSISGYLNEENICVRPPFRSPHHSASMASLTGGGYKVKPGEISLAHCGVLFLDELPEFSRVVLDSLRQPIETGEITVARVNEHVTYPARFQLIAAANPCSCGFPYNPKKSCGQNPQRCIKQYQSRLSGPLLDRFDMIIYVDEVDVRILNDRTKIPESSKEVAKRVQQARICQKKRWENLTGQAGDDSSYLNGCVAANILENISILNEDSQKFFITAAEASGISARGMAHIRRLARTIADIDGSSHISTAHLTEAFSFYTQRNQSR